jgi:hypothetical protein
MRGTTAKRVWIAAKAPPGAARPPRIKCAQLVSQLIIISKKLNLHGTDIHTTNALNRLTTRPSDAAFDTVIATKIST